MTRRRLRESGGQILAGAGLVAGLPSLLPRPMRPDQTRPNGWLLALAGCCEYGDLERLVVLGGLEAAFATLFQLAL